MDMQNVSSIIPQGGVFSGNRLYVVLQLIQPSVETPKIRVCTCKNLSNIAFSL